MAQDALPQESLLGHDLNPYFEGLAQFHSTSKLFRSTLYQSLQKELNRVLSGVEYGFYAPTRGIKKEFYRAVAWNLERGIYFEPQIHVLKHHPDISKADVLLLTETDIGMARTRNQNIARDLASALGMNYFFAPSYLNLCKGNSVEGHYEGENKEALHGNALLSRYPLSNLRAIPLINCKDKMKGREKRLGCQKALVCDVAFPQQTVTMIVAHLDAHSSQKQRAFQMQTILSGVDKNPYPLLVGGDLNTSTYNASHAFYAFCGFWNKVFRGVDHAIEDHYPYPDRYYERPLFAVFKKQGLEYESLNELGVGTLHYHVEDLKGNHLVQEVVPAWCRRIMEETLRRHGGKVSLKLDWFAGRGLKCASEDLGASVPKVIPGLKHAGVPLSDHDPILLDFQILS